MYQDVASDAVLGHYVLCNVVVGYGVGRMSRRLLSDHPAIKTALVLCAALVHGILYTAILYVQKPDISAIRTIGVSVIPGAFYTALVTPVALFLLSRVFQNRKAVQGEAA
jgi:rod shape-determining protein MreD